MSKTCSGVPASSAAAANRGQQKFYVMVREEVTVREPEKNGGDVDGKSEALAKNERKRKRSSVRKVYSYRLLLVRQWVSRYIVCGWRDTVCVLWIWVFVG